MGMKAVGIAGDERNRRVHSSLFSLRRSLAT